VKNQRFLRFLLLAAAGLCLAVWAVRVGPLAFRSSPPLAGTSGCEEEAWFSVWKAVKGFPVYNDPWAPPFSGSYFGWLFYETYGFLSGRLLKWMQAEDAWLPSVCRWITAGFFLGAAAFYRRIFLRWRFPENGVFGLPSLFTVLALFNPLFHWWSFTVRGDMGALAAELLAFWFGLRYAESGRRRDLGGLAAAAYLAWAFRPTSISVLTGMGFWMLTQKRWKELSLLVATMAGVFGASFWMLGPNFLQSVFVANALSGELLGSVAKSNAWLALKQDPLFLFAVLCLPVLLVRAKARWQEGPTRLLALTAILSLLWAVVFSAKVGAAANYYFVPGCLLPLAAWALLDGAKGSVWARAFLGLAATGMVGANLLILSGKAGALRPPSDAVMQELRELRPSLQAPVFCTDRTGNLPWVLGDGERSMVFGYAYTGMLAKMPEKFRQGTIRSLLMEGRFNTLVVTEANASYSPTPEEMAGYEEVKTGSGYRVFQKRN
jgi:hypothetical protein